MKKLQRNYRREDKGKQGMKFDRELQRETAKIGMTATLGVTVATSLFMKNKIAKNAHIVAGAAFCGFALWHTMLYDTKDKKKIKKVENKVSTDS